MRQYLIGSWSNADEYDYSGEQLMGNRLGASREVPHFLVNGRANVAKYGDNTAKATKVPLADRILPQAKRVRVLTEQLIELEAERKAGMDIHTYSKLRDILIVKRDRAEELLKKVVSVRPIREETEEVGEETTYSSCDVNYTDAPIGTSSWLDDLSDKNSLKKPMKKALQVAKTLVRWHHKARSYWQELKEV